MKLVRKFLKSAVSKIVSMNNGEYLLCRGNRFDILKVSGTTFDIIFSSDKISNASELFYNKHYNHALLLNTSGKCHWYDLNSYTKIMEFST